MLFVFFPSLGVLYDESLYDAVIEGSKGNSTG